MEHDMLRRFGCALCALAFALTALPTAAFAQQPEEQAAVQQSLSATDVREMQQADAAVTALTGGSDYAQMTEDERTDAALQQLDALTAQGLVKQGSVYTDAENGMISFTYSCGALGGILLTDPEEENTAALPELDESQLQELAENKRVGTAAIYYAFDNTINSTRYPYYAYMQTYWDSVGLQTDLDTTVTVSDLRRMGRYDLCILSTHGAYYTYSQCEPHAPGGHRHHRPFLDCRVPALCHSLYLFRHPLPAGRTGGKRVRPHRHRGHRHQ